MQYEEAYKRMQQGAIMSCGQGEFDYYIVKSDKLCGYYSGDDDEPVESQEQLEGSWYVVRDVSANAETE